MKDKGLFETLHMNPQVRKRIIIQILLLQNFQMQGFNCLYFFVKVGRSRPSEPVRTSKCERCRNRPKDHPFQFLSWWLISDLTGRSVLELGRSSIHARPFRHFCLSVGNRLIWRSIDSGHFNFLPTWRLAAIVAHSLIDFPIQFSLCSSRCFHTFVY